MYCIYVYIFCNLTNAILCDNCFYVNYLSLKVFLLWDIRYFYNKPFFSVEYFISIIFNDN